MISDSVRPLRVARRAVLLAVLGAIGAGGVAHAATLSYDGDNTLIYTDAPGASSSAYPSYNADGSVTFYSAGVTIDPTAAGDCAETGQGTGNGHITCALYYAGLRLDMGDGNDSVSVFTSSDAWPAEVPFTINGGAGNDNLNAGETQGAAKLSGATINGGDGDDTINGSPAVDTIDGGTGNDVITGYGAADVIHAGDGDDTLTGDSFYDAPAPDLLDGGPGTDTIAKGWSSNADSVTDYAAETVTLDGVANDGRAGENDNVISVENIGVARGSITGDDSPNILTHEQYTGPATLDGRGGDDRLLGSDDNGDTLLGGAGNDVLLGEGGDDTIVGGPGQDTIDADGSSGCILGPYYGQCTYRTGNDTIDVDDGEKDTVNCGPGVDTVKADQLDSLTGCENVTRSGTPPAPGPGPGPAPGPTKPVTPSAVKLSFVLKQVSVRRGRALKVAFTTSRPGLVTLTVRKGAATKATLSKKLLTSGLQRLTLSPATTRKLKKGRYTLRLSFRPTGSATPKLASIALNVKA